MKDPIWWVILLLVVTAALVVDHFFGVAAGLFVLVGVTTGEEIGAYMERRKISKG